MLEVVDSVLLGLYGPLVLF